MEIKTENKNIRIILGKKIDLTNSEKLHEEGKNLVEKDINNIIFDFKNVKEIDSSGIGKILVFNKMMREKKGNLVIENVNSDYVKKIFKRIDLGEVTEIRD